MELNYWISTECLSAQYDDDQGEWQVRVRRNGEQLTLRPQQLVLATGAYGFPKIPSFPGTERFRGETFHTANYQDGSAYRGKKCVVIGSGSSAHDICVDLWENGAGVTMLQRSSSIIVRSETLMEFGFAALYSEQALARGITTDIADHLFASVPFRLKPQTQKPLYAEIARHDAQFYRELTEAGFNWDFGEDDSGLMMKALRTASGYYIDVGACDLIISGDISVKSGVAIESVGENALQLSDGSRSAM
jgi:putative flavoprotein involved in K+ transport